MSDVIDLVPPPPTKSRNGDRKPICAHCKQSHFSNEQIKDLYSRTSFLGKREPPTQVDLLIFMSTMKYDGFVVYTDGKDYHRSCLIEVVSLKIRNTLKGK